ncbi:hypothetical protein D3C72_1087260 [compost metagenome]
MDPTHVSAFSATGVQYGSSFSTADLYVATWGGSNYGSVSEFTWQFASTGTTTIINQGSFLYNDVAGMEVGIVMGNAAPRILVAYYKLGAGHFVDIYDVTTSTVTPVVFNSSIQLSSADQFGRIRMDGLCIAGWETIVWEHPGMGIHAIAYDNNTSGWSASHLLYHTELQMAPDVAMRYNNNPGSGPDVNLVYNDDHGVITKSTIDWNVLNTTSPTIIVPNIEDTYTAPNYIGNTISPAVIDCPESCPANNWAYTYSDSRDVYVRYMDHFTSGTVNTAEITTGNTFGNVPLNIHEAYSPSLHYGFTDQYGSIINDGITVTWYTTDKMSLFGYVGVQMKPDGGSLINAADYMGLPNGFTSSEYPFLPGPGIALSKSDLEAVPFYQYAAYYDYDPAIDQYSLHHAFHAYYTWSNNVFKSQKNIQVTSNTYPNPFFDVINTSVTLHDKGLVKLELIDITGRVVAHQERQAEKGTWMMQLRGLENITSGTYFLCTVVDGQKTNTRTLIKK